MKNTINNLFNFDLKNIFWKKKEEINKETNDKIDDCIENNSRNKEEKFEDFFSSNLININFFFEKIETKNKEILKERELLENNIKHIAEFSIKISDYKELVKAYLIYLKDEIKKMRDKWVFTEEINKINEKILNYEKEFHQILDKIKK